MRRDEPPRAGARGTLLLYVLLIAATVGLFFLIRAYGETLSPSGMSAARPRTPRGSSPHALVHLLVALAAVIALGRVLSWLFSYVRQPPVIGEVLAGICLGPSVWGAIAPEWGRFVLPDEVAPALSIVAQLGVILYMFGVGLELNLGSLRAQGHQTVAISHASIVVPFSLGALLALWLYPRLATADVAFTSFALFLSVSMSITAFPVLARILTDLGLTKTELGVMALACAAVDDASAWCLLALVVGVVRADVSSALGVALWTLGFLAFMLVVVRPLARRLVPRCCPDGLTPGVTAVLLALALVSAVITEVIGVHAIFGAFVLGAVIPHDSKIAGQLVEKIEGLVAPLLLPAFFAFTGMRTHIGLVNGLDQWLVTAAIIAVATLGKFGGTYAAAHLLGIPWRGAASLGVLMNTRGLMELIVLNVGLDLGVISPTLFAMMVLMAIVTTVATSPILRVLLGETAPTAKAM